MPQRHEWSESKAAASTSKVTPEVLALMVELLPTIGSLRDLCAVTGLRLDAVRREAAPFLAIMKLTGTHPKCGCGRDRFHPYGCVDSYAKGDQNPVPGHPIELHGVILAKREVAISLLVQGARFVDVDTALGLYPKSARKYLRFLTQQQLEERERRIAAATQNLQSEVRRAA